MFPLTTILAFISFKSIGRHFFPFEHNSNYLKCQDIFLNEKNIQSYYVHLYDLLPLLLLPEQNLKRFGKKRRLLFIYAYLARLVR